MSHHLIQASEAWSTSELCPFMVAGETGSSTLQFISSLVLEADQVNHSPGVFYFQL